jgi:TPR repeat protein
MAKSEFLGSRVSIAKVLEYQQKVVAVDLPECTLMVSNDEHEDMEKVAAYLKRLADSGNADGQCSYGVVLSRRSSREAKEAASYFKMSADQGHPIGQCRYGECLEHGTGVARDRSEALQYYKLSVDQGNEHGKAKLERFDWDSWLCEMMDEHMKFLAQRFELAVGRQRELFAGCRIELEDLKSRHWALEQQLLAIQKSTEQSPEPAADPDSASTICLTDFE